MTEHAAAPVHPIALRVSAVAAAGAALIGALVLLGWVTGSEPLLGRLRPDMIVMLPNTAVAFLLAGVGIWLMRPGSGPPRVAAQACAFLVLAIGAATFFERMTGLSLGIDLLLFRERVLAYPYEPPGLMASNSTVCFVLAGIGLVFLAREPRVRTLPRELAALAGLGVSGVALLGYVYGASPLYTFDRAAGMALVTALAFALVHVGLLFARPHTGGVALIAGRDLTGEVARPLLAAVLVLPVLTGGLWIRGREAELFSREGGTALFAMLNISLLLTVMLLVARVLRGTDLRRQTLLARERELRSIAETARAEAEAANRVKTEFLATMSHELRTPLNAIIGYSSLMQEGITGALTEQQRRHVGRVRVSADHLLSLIDQVLALARIEAGSIEVALGHADTHRLADEAAGIAAPLFAGKPVRFTVRIEGAGRLLTDADRVRQILINLLSNAAKFTAEGEVVLTAGVDDRRGVALFHVADTGIGIDPEHHERIFDPFWQVDRTHTRPFEGVGLGLSVSRELALRLGGSLTVTSRLGEGSTFRLELPLAPAAPSQDGDRSEAGIPAPSLPASPIPPTSDIYSDAQPSQ